MPATPQSPRVALVTLGCARNEVDSEELAGRLTEDGWELVDPDSGPDCRPDVVVVNTCGFVAAAKKDSIDTLLAAGRTPAPRSSRWVAWPSATARAGAQLARGRRGARLRRLPRPGRPAAPTCSPAGGSPAHSRWTAARCCRSRPASRPAALAPRSALPGHGWLPTARRRRLDDAPVAPLKLASGCDRRCAFCAIPTFRGAFVSRPPDEVLAEAAWLAGQGARELVLVSENSTSYGKDLGDLRALETLLPGWPRSPASSGSGSPTCSPPRPRPAW